MYLIKHRTIKSRYTWSEFVLHALSVEVGMQLETDEHALDQ
jgi:hypothetical protein